MAQLWGGRFTKDTDELVYRFNASITFDKKLFEQDIEGSIAHVVMLEKQGILTCEEKDAIVKGLTGIRKDVEEGSLVITDDPQLCGGSSYKENRGGRQKAPHREKPERPGGS